MSIKSILVCLHPMQNPSAVIEVAVGLARRHRAHLAGLHVLPQESERSGLTFKARASALERAFDEQADKFQLSHESYCMEGDIGKVITLESRCHDILVIGQADPTAGGMLNRPQEILETILIKSGHPLIAVPYSGSWSKVGERILIAWDGDREAARATEDAMPILSAAQKVIVLTVDLRRGTALSVEHLLNLLARHGVSAEARGVRSQGEPIGQTILSAAADCRCDLVVMGGYGHSRIREHLLGGSTYSVIEHMSLPVLMSH